MAKGAAKENTLGKLHSKLAVVFLKVLEKYEADLDAKGNMEDDLLAAAMEVAEPSPAMLSAIAKFLKDNDIGMDSEEVEELSATQRRLQERRAARKASGVDLSVVPLVANE